MGVAYAIVAVAVAGAANIFLPGLGPPPSALTLVLALLVLGFPVALVLAWAYDITPDGVVRIGAESTASGHDDRAIAEVDFPMAWASRSLALRNLGRREEADQNVARLEARARSEYVSPTAMAFAYLGSGDVDKAFDSFEEGAEIQDFMAGYLRIRARVWSIADDPRYLALRSRIWPDEFGGSAE